MKPRPSQPLNWTVTCQVAFEKLKRLFAIEPILKHLHPDKPFVIQADASNVAMGAVLMQINGRGELQPCVYMSSKLSDAERQ